MPKGFVGDETGDGGIGNHIINAGLNGLGKRQMVGPVHKGIHLSWQSCHHIGYIVRALEIKHLDNLPIFPVNKDHYAADVSVVLIQFPIDRDKKLGYLHGAEGYHGVENVRTLALKLLLRLLAKFQ